MENEEHDKSRTQQHGFIREPPLREHMVGSEGSWELETHFMCAAIYYQSTKISSVPKHLTHSTFNLIGSCNKNPNIQSHKATKNTYALIRYFFFQNSLKVETVKELEIKRDGNILHNVTNHILYSLRAQVGKFTADFYLVLSNRAQFLYVCLI